MCSAAMEMEVVVVAVAGYCVFTFDILVLGLGAARSWGLVLPSPVLAQCVL